MDEGNYSGNNPNEEPFEPFANLCQVLIAVWFTAFVIMVGDVLVLRNARLRAEQQRLEMVEPDEEEIDDSGESEPEIRGLIYFVHEIRRAEAAEERDDSEESEEDIENIGAGGREGSRQNEIEEKFVNVRL